MTSPPDRWLVVHVPSPSEERTHVLAEGLVASGGTAVVEDAGVLTTWIEHPDDVDATIAAVRRRLERAVGQPIELRFEVRAAEDWLARWREGLGPRRVGRHLIITPSWITPETESAEDVVIVIDPKMAFGTGEHASTRGALRLLEANVRAGTAVLDVGAGSAVLSIAAARLGAGRVLAVEVDAAALDNARANIEDNGVAHRVTLEHAEVDTAWLADHPAAFDLILANVLSGVLRPLLPAFRRSVGRSGTLILGGILEEEAGAVIRDAVSASFQPDAEDREAGWWTGGFTAV
jgi:ribosomal protein L11 methyltransferase